MSNRESAKRYLGWYFLIIAKNAGIELSDRDRAEIDGIVDLIIEAAVEETLARLKAEQAADTAGEG